MLSFLPSLVFAPADQSIIYPRFGSLRISSRMLCYWLIGKRVYNAEIEECGFKASQSQSQAIQQGLERVPSGTLKARLKQDPVAGRKQP